MLKPFKSSKVQAVQGSRTLFILTLELLNPLNLETAFAQANFYQGKTVKVIVGSAPGGGYDQWARLMAQHIGKHIPGNPTVVVQNMPGAGGAVAANFVYASAKPDGLTLGALQPALYFEQLVRPPGNQIRLGKFTWIGSPEKNDIVHFIRADSPLKRSKICATPKIRRNAAIPAPATRPLFSRGCWRTR